MIGLGTVAGGALVVLAACNPMPKQATEVRTGGVSRSGYVTYTGDQPGWIEVSVRTAADEDVSVVADGRDTTRPSTWEDSGWCYFTSPSEDVWIDGASQGYRRLEQVGPGTRFLLTFTAPTAGTTYDVRVVDDEGNLIGDLETQAPVPGDEEPSWDVCNAG
jgi:hypothetical protein